MVKTLVDIFRAKGHAPQGAHNGGEALELLGKMPFDCVMTDIRMNSMDGLTLFRAIRGAGHTLPVVFMTAYADEEVVRQGLDEGVVGAIIKPFDMERLLAFLNRVRRAGSVLIVDDDPGFCLAVEDILQARGFAAKCVSSAAALECVRHPEHQTILLDMKFDRAGGLEILGEIRKRWETVPVILVTGYRERIETVVNKALEREVHACLEKPVDVDRLLTLLAELRHAELRRLLAVPAGGGR
jgi:DNA-binding NtrC family response regulator